jgi:hypothetical protein
MSKLRLMSKPHRLPTWSVCSLLFIAQLCCCEMLGQIGANTTIYGTVIERDSGKDALVPGSDISFVRSGGASTTVRTDSNGKFRIILPSNYSYSVTVSRKGFCPTGRPPFEARAEKSVLFDFVLTANCPKDVVINSADGDTNSVEVAFCANAGVYYCDEQIALTTTKSTPVMVRFVSRTVQGHILTYGSESSHPSASARPTSLRKATVLVAFDTTTISADKAALDLDKGDIVARGHVSITHDNEQVSAGSECMRISISDAAQGIRTCN